MKQAKKNDLIDKAEIVDDPTKKYIELKKINEEMDKLLDTETNLKSLLEQTEKDLSQDVYHDQEVAKKDTVNVIKYYFEKIITDFSIVREMNSNLREKLYFLIYNTSIIFYDYCHRFRQHGYSIHACKYLIWVIALFESNIVLSGIKYLKWRIKLYIELSYCYEDYGAYKAAYKVIVQAINKVSERRAIEEQQLPLPDFIKSTLTDSFRILKTFEFKYGLYVI